MVNLSTERMKIEVTVTFPSGVRITEVSHHATYDGLMLELTKLCSSAVREVRNMMCQDHWEFLWHRKPEPNKTSADASKTSLG